MIEDTEQKLMKELYLELEQLVKFKSVSTDPEYFNETKECCSYVKKRLENFFNNVEEWTISEDMHSVLFAQNIISEKLPTVLFYCHYDVQPVDPINLWKSDPFVLTERKGNLYGRGASDNKGHLTYVLRALETFFQSDLKNKVNIKILIEGEEESGSESLYQLLEKEIYKEKLVADHLLIVDVGMDALDKPSILLGARGLLATEVMIRVSESDAHSGEWGSVIDNPLRILASMITKLKDETGEILIPQFYEDIQSYTGLDFPSDEEVINNAKSALGSKKFLPDLGYRLAESVATRPSCDVNGLSGGYAGTGFKTVIPAIAIAKISFRLVKGQDPDRIFSLFKKFFESLVPENVEMTINYVGGGQAIFSDTSTSTIQILKSAVEKVFKTQCKLSSCGGSIPVSYKLWEASKGGVVFVGTGLPNDRIHAPNEKFSYKQLLMGYKIIMQFLTDLSEPS